ncbi:MAG: GDSL-type esterase/lipase family protein [Anaerolineae bacterium]|nr:GDSL-type esterase/lipase family protein [Anaerolineae bacterium]
MAVRRLHRGTIIIAILFLSALLSSDTPLRKPIVIVVLGDSVTYGACVEPDDSYVSKLQHMLGDGYQVINEGVPGERSWNALSRLDAVLAHEPDILIIFYGTNDVKDIKVRRKTWGDFEEAMTSLASSAPKAILVTPHRGIERPRHHYFLEDVDYAAELIREMGYPVADVNALCCRPVQLCDYDHPNEEGHEVIAQAIFAALSDAALDK